MKRENLRSQLEVIDYLVPVRLGCTAAERAMPQEVRFSLKVDFAELPAGCQTDRLEDTLCYAEICQKICEVAKKKEYQLVESLAYDIVESLRALLAPSMMFELTVHKVRPPIDHLQGGVHFTLRGQN